MMKRITKQLAILIGMILVLVSWLNAMHSADPMTPSNNSAQDLPKATAIFKSRCATCHGKDGRAKTFKAKFNGARNLTEASWQKSVTDERIFNSISNGRGKKMPAFGQKLSQAEIESLVSYVRELKR